MADPTKILAIQTKSLGDAVMMIPALRAIRRRFPDAALHVLVPAAVAPLLQREPALTRLWTVPRTAGRADFGKNWPLIRALRAERFDCSVDFANNDRSAILSLLYGARERIGTHGLGGFWGRRHCYTQCLPSAKSDRHETLRLLHILSVWGIEPTDFQDIRIGTDDALDAAAAELLPAGAILCHLGSSRPDKEWPVEQWAEFHRLADAAGCKLVFSAGANARELALLQSLKRAVPEAAALPTTLPLALFLAVIKRAGACVCGDTGPMHFAAGLGVPTVGLFGPTNAVQWRPLGARQHLIQGARCDCDGPPDTKQDCTRRMTEIRPEKVFRCLQKIIAAKPPSAP